MYIVKIINNKNECEIHGIKEKLKTGSIVKGINAIDSFSFDVLPSNQCFNIIEDLQTLVNIYNTNKNRYEYYGRVLYSSVTMDENGLISKNVICESYLGFLCDSMQEYVAEKNWTVSGLLKHIIDIHNSQVESHKQFTIGNVNVTDPNDNLYLGIQVDNTWNTIQEKLINKLGGEISFRVVDDKIYLDYLEQIGSEMTNPIKLSKNMKAITREKNPLECISRLIPYGCKLKDKDGNETEERLDITGVNGGKNYVEDEDAVKAYGVRYGTVTFDDVTLAENLLTKAEQYLYQCSKVQVKYSVDTLDLSLLGLDISDFEVGNFHPVENPLLGIHDTVRIIKKTIDVCEEIKTSIEIGDNFKTALGIQIEETGKLKEVLEGIDRIQSSTDNLQGKTENINLAVIEAQKAAERAVLDAAEALAAADGVSGAANEAKEQAQAAKDAADAAVEAASAASDKAEAVEVNLTAVNTEISTIKEDAAEMREDLEGQIETYKTTAEQTFATKNDVSTTETTLRQEYQESIAGLQLSFAQDYAKKTELEDAVTDVEARLQSQITVNANTIQTTVSSVESMRVDITNQNGEIAAAQKAAADAQTVADEAKEQATAANSAAIQAQAAADEAKTKAETANQELQEAEQDLADAKLKLAAVESSANANAEDIAAAQQAVEDAQAAVQVAQSAADQAKADAATAQAAADQAKADAATAQAAANAAQESADKANEDLNALKTRVIACETSIEQHSEAIALRATKTELQAVSTNLSNNYYTKTQTDAEIKEMSDSISLSVSSVRSIVEATQEELDALSVGGRNLLLNTKTDGKQIYVDGATTAMAGITGWTNTGGILTLNCSTSATEIYYRFMSPNTGSMNGLEAGKDYTISGKMKVATTSGTLLYVAARSQHHNGTSWIGGINEAIVTQDSDEWVSFAFTHSIPKSVVSVYFSIQAYYEGSWAGIIQLKDLKLEKGNKATDWTPAPEDMATVQALSAAEARIDIVENKITQQVSVTDGLTTKVSTLEQTASGLTLRLNTTDSNVTAASNAAAAAQTTANGAASAAAAAQADIDGLSVGGRNLIAGTSLDTIYSGNKGSSSYKDVWTGKTIDIPAGTEYVVSFEAKADVAQAIQCFFYSPNTTTSSKSSTGQTGTGADGACNVILTTEWKRYWVKWTQTAATAAKNVIVGRNATANNIYIRAVKFEEGNMPTAWTPAPEDVDSDISTAQSTANTARTEAANAAKTATNYVDISGTGLIVGNLTNSTLGKNVLIDTDSVDIRNGTTVLASFGAETIDLGIASATSKINLCGEAGYIQAMQDEYSAWNSLAMHSYNLYFYSGSTRISTSTQYIAETTQSFSESAHATISADSYQGGSNHWGDVTLRARSEKKGADARITVHTDYNIGSYIEFYASSSSSYKEAIFDVDGLKIGGIPIAGDRMYHSNGTLTTLVGYDSPYYYFRPATDTDVVLGSSGNPWFKTYTARLEVIAERIQCLPSYSTTTTYATNVYINSAGWFTRTTNTSSRTIKHDIEVLSAEELKAENLYNLDVVQFKYNDEIITDMTDARYGKDLVGFIIEDMNEVYPIAVDKPTDDVKEWSWNAQYLIPPMLKLIQDQKKQIDELEKLVEQLLPI